ncbi:MAG: hypothetical protein Q4F31_10650 [Eubacteriales bacterium]|nr:hypothetical protein [Eubacteriales bacterium]
MNARNIKWVNLILFFIMITVNSLSELLPIGYGNTSSISADYPSLFTPAGYTFSIWGVIYAFMLLFIVWQWAAPGFGSAADWIITKTGLMFAVSCLMNTGWIFAWHYKKMGLSVLFILGLLVSLVLIQRVFLADPCKNMSCRIISIGFDIYLGWIIAAAIANISVFLVSISWNGFGLSEVFWTCVVLLFGALIGSLPVIITGRYFTTFAVVWAYFGILVKYLIHEEMTSRYPVIILFTAISIVLMLMSTCYTLIVSGTDDRVTEIIPEVMEISGNSIEYV